VYGDNVTVVLGDNIFQDNIKEDISAFTSGSKIFLKEVIDANRFGVAELKGNTVIGIEEKPENPKSNFAVAGLYIYDCEIFDVIKTLLPSGRGELEITDVNNYYINKAIMRYRILNGFWSDAGTFESLFRASELVRDFSQK
jgi:glucose-1-phosphate thymidylyltransferase